MFRRLILAVPFIFFGIYANAETQLIHTASRGELLYSTHCIACHNTQIHWREKKLVTDWTSLKSEIQRWQGISALEWNNADIEDVARYLNTVFYHYPTSD
jgi:mono/diheme cytochrome c family protein